MACQCLSARVLPTVGCHNALARRPLPLLANARSQASACTGTKPSRSNHGQFLGSCKTVAAFTKACRHKGRQHHKTITQAYSQKPDIADRVVASVPYLIPLCDGLRYGEWNARAHPAARLTEYDRVTQGCLLYRQILFCTVPWVC